MQSFIICLKVSIIFSSSGVGWYNCLTAFTATTDSGNQDSKMMATYKMEITLGRGGCLRVSIKFW
jgi:hypothetical protein